MRVISVILGDREIARIDEEGNFKQLVEFKGLAQPSVRQLYEDCFYGVPNSSTFDERFELVKVHKYFCWTKPNLQLAARTLPEEVPMAENEIGTSINRVYGMLREVLALYEKTECFNTVPEGEKEQDIQEYMGNKLLDVKKEINRLFPGEEKISAQLIEIVDETEQFVKSYEIPGVVEKWKQINPHIVFFDCAFELRETCPEMFHKMRQGLTDKKLSCYPDETLVAARNRYFEEVKKKVEDEYLEYSEERAFQNELLKTLTLVFKHDFKEYFDPEEPA